MVENHQSSTVAILPFAFYCLSILISYSMAVCKYIVLQLFLVGLKAEGRAFEKHPRNQIPQTKKPNILVLCSRIGAIFRTLIDDQCLVRP